MTITSPSSGFTNDSTPLLTYDVSKGSVAVTVDGISVSTLSGSSLAQLSEGTHTVRVQATDTAGLTDFAEVTFVVDTIAPAVTITSPSPGYTNIKTPQIVYTVNEGTAVVKVDGVAVNKTSGERLDSLRDRAHKVRVEATDLAGNMGFAEVSFTVDTLPPAVVITSPANGAIVGNTPALTYDLSEGTAVVMVDGIQTGNLSGDTLAFPEDGEHTIRVEATDLAENTGYAESVFTVLDEHADDDNPYCMGTQAYTVGPSNFTNGISVPTTGNAVRIASPAYGMTVTESEVIVKGAMDTTIPVTGVVMQVVSSSGTGTYSVQVNGNYFAAEAPVSAGDNTFTITATDQNGDQHQASVTVTGELQEGSISVQANPSVGIPTLKQNGLTTFDSILTAESTLTKSAINYSWDFNGSGSEQLKCVTHPTVTASYEDPGLYVTTVTVTDALQNKHKDTVIVNVLDYAAMNEIFSGTWSSMKNALANGDIAAGLTYFAESSKDIFNEQFTALAPYLPQIASEIGSFTLVKFIDSDVVEGEVRISSGGRTYSFQVIFTRDESGNWVIRSF